MKSERIAIRLDTKRKQQLEKVAAKYRRKYSDQARIYIEDALDIESKKK